MLGIQPPAIPSRNGKRSAYMIKEQPRKTRRFTRTPSTADEACYGDTWVRLIEVAAQAPEWFDETNQENEEKIALALYLDGKADVLLSEFVNLYQDRRWRDMASRWCSSRVGRETLHICQWVGMIGLGIDDFFFSLFDTVLHTLSRLPTDAVSNVSWNDWKQMSRRLTGEEEKREGELQQLFYHDHTVEQCINPSTTRRSGFLAILDDAAYWEVYDGIMKAPGLRFMNINALTVLSLREAKTLRRVMRHVVAWVDPDVEWVEVNKRNRDKPALRKRLIPALKHFDVLSVKMCGTRLKARIARVQKRREAETASIILQQEVLEFVLDNLEAFMAKTVVEYLENGLDNPSVMESNGYAWRFRDPTWAGVLNIVRWYVGSDFKLEWTMTEGRSSQRPMINDTMEFVNALCRHIENTGFLSRYRAFEGTINSDGFKKKLADFVWAQCKIDQKEPQEPRELQDREDVGLSGRIVTRQTPVLTRPCYQGVDDSSPDEEVDGRFEKVTSKASHGATSTRSAIPPSAQAVGSGW